jgi:peptide/nickel transport system substrate-binding protein
MAQLPEISRRSLLLGGVAAAAAPWLLTACGSSSPSATALPTAGTVGVAKRGGRMRIARPPASNAETLDPASSLSAYEYLGALYSRLVKEAPDGTAAADLATGWQVSPDAKSWTFTLRKGVTFHDGKPFTSADAAYTLRHIIDPATASPQAGVLTPFLKASDISTPDPHTLVVKLTAPNSEFVTLLMNYNCYVIPDGSAKTIGKTGIGTGPFKLVSYAPAGEGIVAANTDYYGGRPVLDSILFTAISDEQARVNALLAGQVDLVSQTNLDWATIKEVHANSGLTTATVKNASIYVLPMLCTKSPFTDVRVRQAFKLAYQPKYVMDLAIHGLGTVANNNPVTPDDPNYLDYVIPPDPGKAKSLLKQAGYGSGSFSQVLYASGYDPVLTPLAEAYQSSAASAGITIKIQNAPADSYYTDVWIKKPFCVSYWYTGRPTDQLLNQVYRMGSGYDESLWSDATFDGLLDAARRTVDPAKRKTLYQDAQKLMIEDDGTIVPFFADRTTGLSKKVVNYSEYGFEFDYLHIGFRG